MPQYGKIEDIIDDLKQYINTNLELLKLEATGRSSDMGAGLISSFIIGMIGFIFVLLVSLGIAYYLSDIFGNAYIGFVIVAGFYLLIWLILILGKKKLLEKPLRDIIVRKILGNSKY